MTTTAIGPELAAGAVLQYGWACKGDHSHGQDGKRTRDDMEAVAALIRGEIGIVEFRAKVDLCPTGGEHWTEYCDDGCTPKLTPTMNRRRVRVYSGDALLMDVLIPEGVTSYSPPFDLRTIPNLRIDQTEF